MTAAGVGMVRRVGDRGQNSRHLPAGVQRQKMIRKQLGAGDGVVAGVGEGVATAVGWAVGTGVGKAVGVAAGVGEGVGLGAGESVGGGVGVGLRVGLGEGVATDVGAGVGGGDAVGRLVGFGVGAATGGRVSSGAAPGSVTPGVASSSAPEFGDPVAPAEGEGPGGRDEPGVTSGAFDATAAAGSTAARSSGEALDVTDPVPPTGERTSAPPLNRRTAVRPIRPPSRIPTIA
jgi:hypothetical protein